MKKIFYYIFYLTLLIACQNRDTPQSVSPHSVALSAVLDFTDKKELWALPDPILELFHCSQFPDDEYYFHLALISDKKLNPVKSIYLATAEAMAMQDATQDAQYRNKNIVLFYDHVRTSFKDTYGKFDTTHAADFSECFTTICEQLNWLQQTKAREKILIIYSDLFEKSQLLNAYTDISQKDTGAMIKLFEATRLLPEQLQGVTVFFVYQPVSRIDDERFSLCLLFIYDF